MKTQFPHATTMAAWILALFAAPMLLAFDSTPYPGPHPPDGSAAYPWKIDRPEDFDAIGTDGIHLASHHYVLTKNIDCGNQDHRIRVDFSGSLDGAYHRISRIRVDQPDEMHAGLVANMISPSTIRRLGIVDSYFRARDAAGSIAGAMGSGTLVEECLSQGNTIIAVSGNGQGGIVGACSYVKPAAVVRNSFARDNSVSSGFQTVGGICGYNDARIERCYSAGSTMTAPRYVGGVVGWGGSGTIVDSYSHLTNSPAVQVGSGGGTWQNARVPDRYTSNFDITLYSIAELNWDPAVWTKGADNYPVLVGFSNQPPVCDAGVNWEIATSDQADIEITGSASDADLDPLQYRWLAGATVLLDWTAVTEDGHAPLALGSLPSFPIGTHTLTLEVTDMLATVSDEMLLTVKEPGPWHFVLAGGKPVKLVWQTQIGEVYNLLLSDDLAAWTTADGFPKTATAATMEFAFVATERGFFKIVPISAGFSLIPAGSFTMGRTSGDADTDAPPVTVHVSAFHMAQYEVTKALWDEVRAWGLANGYSDLPAGGGKAADHPVHSVNWFDVVKWCNARSERDGLTPVYTNGGDVMRTGTAAPLANWSANGYRLPTEAEWEKAARGGVAGWRFPWGDEITHSQANYYSHSNYSYDTSPTRGYHPTYNDGTTPYTSPVGSFAPNGYGLYDMAGNVWNWCWDWYSASTYTEGASDPKGPASGTFRVVRGGGWVINAFRCRSADRSYDTPGGTSGSYGFRPARSSVP